MTEAGEVRCEVCQRELDDGVRDDTASGLVCSRVWADSTDTDTNGEDAIGCYRRGYERLRARVKELEECLDNIAEVRSWRSMIP